MKSEAVVGLVLSAVVAVGGWLIFQPRHAEPAPAPAPVVVPQPYPVPTPRPIVPIPYPVRPYPYPYPYPYPHPHAGAEPGAPVEGGKVSPDGAEEIMCDLPQSEKKKNVGGRDGAGLCVFTSIEYCARFANERRLFDLQQHMRKEPGGGYPQKVDVMLKKYGSGVQYTQYEGGDLNVLRAAMKTGRMLAVTYNGHDIHYRGGISHMVSLVHLSDRWAAIGDNNFINDNQYVWMSPQEFSKRFGGKSGWMVCLFAPPPPPVPKN